MIYELNSSTYKQLVKRPLLDKKNEEVERVQTIVQRVKAEGLSAISEFANKFDRFQGDRFLVKKDLIGNAKSDASDAIRESFENLKLFHQPQVPKSYELENRQGVQIGAKWRPIKRVGLTIPGGTAPLVSTVLMLGVPALLAGVKQKVLITPADCPENISKDILFTANLCQIEEIYCLGGAHGIAALAYGCEEFKKVDKIFGPGSFYVDQAKRFVSIDDQGAAIDMPAGPSEVLVIADRDANPKFIASDLLAQLEHGIDSQAIMITDCSELPNEVEKELARQYKKLSRSFILKNSINNIRLIKTNSIKGAIEFSEEYAPEHLILHVTDPENLLEKISNAGSIFLGAFTPETLGDYCSGTNHILPTSGFARSHAGLGVADFMRKITYQKATALSLKESSKTLTALTRIEGLDAHQNAVTARLEEVL